MQIAPATTASVRTPARSAEPRTALQKHVDFFDRNGDGETRVSETYEGLRALGLGRVASAGAAVAINLGLGVKTGASWLNPLTIYNDNIHQGKHDSDTDVYDESGNFVAARFDAMFASHDRNQDGALSDREVKAMIAYNKDTLVGSLASKAEFGLLMKLAGEERDGQQVLSRERLQSFYDGSLFYTLAGENPPA